MEKEPGSPESDGGGGKKKRVLQLRKKKDDDELTSGGAVGDGGGEEGAEHARNAGSGKIGAMLHVSWRNKKFLFSILVLSWTDDGASSSCCRCIDEKGGTTGEKGAQGAAEGD